MEETPKSVGTNTLRITTTVGLVTLVMFGYMLGRQDHRMQALEQRSAEHQIALEKLSGLPHALGEIQRAILRIERSQVRAERGQ